MAAFRGLVFTDLLIKRHGLAETLGLEMEVGQPLQRIRVIRFQFQDLLIFANRLRFPFPLFIGRPQIEVDHRIIRLQLDRLSVILDLLFGQPLSAIGQAEIGIGGGVLRLPFHDLPVPADRPRRNFPS